MEVHGIAVAVVIAAMNVELPPFKSGERNYESVSTIGRYITPLNCIAY